MKDPAMRKTPTKVRLQKVIAEAGVASRRKAEDLIAQGRVQVNGAVVDTPGVKVDPSRDHIKVDGKIIRPATLRLVLALNKPRGYVSTMSDPEGRPTVADLLPHLPVRVFPVGRLDYNSEGLLLLTNDGDLAQRIAHPRYGVPRHYVVRVRGVMEQRALNRLRSGVKLEDGMTSPAEVKVIRSGPKNTWLKMTLREGKNQQIKRMCEAVGHPVVRLKRTGIGSLSLGSLKQKELHFLEAAEVEALRNVDKRTNKQVKRVPHGRSKEKSK